MTIDEFVNYIDDAFERTNDESVWYDEDGYETCIDIGCVHEWWEECMKPELKRKFGGDFELCT